MFPLRTFPGRKYWLASSYVKIRIGLADENFFFNRSVQVFFLRHNIPLWYEGATAAKPALSRSQSSRTLVATKWIPLKPASIASPENVSTNMFRSEWLYGRSTRIEGLPS